MSKIESLKREDFLLLKHQGAVFHTAIYTFIYAYTVYRRFSTIASKKKFSLAVNRNYQKRIVRELFNIFRDSFCNMKILILCKPGDFSYQERKSSFLQFVKFCIRLGNQK